MEDTASIVLKTLGMRSKLVLYATLDVVKKRRSGRKSVSPDEVSRVCAEIFRTNLTSREVAQTMKLLSDLHILKVTSRRQKLYRLDLDPVELEKALKNDPDILTRLSEKTSR